MRDDEWDAWRAWTVSEYADEHGAEQGLHPEQALAQAEQETDALLPDGLGTPGHHLSSRRIRPRADASAISGSVHGPADPDPAVAWLYDIFVEEAERGRGVGRAMLELFEIRGARRADTAGSSSTCSATTPRPSTSTTRWGTWRWRVRWARTSTTSLRWTTWREGPARVAPTRSRRRAPPATQVAPFLEARLTRRAIPRSMRSSSSARNASPCTQIAVGSLPFRLEDRLLQVARRLSLGEVVPELHGQPARLGQRRDGLHASHERTGHHLHERLVGERARRCAAPGDDPPW